MDLTLPEALDRLRIWESSATELNVMMLGDASAFVLKCKGHVSVHDHGVILAGANGFELTVPLRAAMMFAYNDALLEIRALGWRCCLFEDKTDPGLRLVK